MGGKFTEHVKVRLSPEDAETIRRKAELAGIGLSTFLREAGVGRHVQSTCDMRMLTLLNKLGGMTKKMWSEGRRDEAEAIRAGLAGIKRAIEEATKNGR